MTRREGPSAEAGPRAWRPSLGAWPEPGGTRFRVWAPTTRRVDLIAETPERQSQEYPLDRQPDGTFTGLIDGIAPGARYRYRLDGEGPYPDPASRCQPDGVHGPSEVVAADEFTWSCQEWHGITLAHLVVYELHVGTFSETGTFDGVRERLEALRDLGVTAIELMPVADFAGDRNWGYDGAALFAPARCYGRPDDLRRLVDAAHTIGLAVLLDVVYNHLGPDGAYLPVFSPFVFSERHRSPWGAGINLDGEGSTMLREFFVENALHWLHEYRLDGLRLDATHALVDDGSRHFLTELSERVGASLVDRSVLTIAEDHRNLAVMITPRSTGGWGLDAVWADDFHHQVRRLTAGDIEGYYRDFSGSAVDLATTIRQGWFYTGQHSEHLGGPRGSDPTGLPLERFVICLQNHDQVGNRALGGRLHHDIDLSTYRAVSALLLCAPETPLLFMGQEWAASTPFAYFTDHQAELGRLVTEGRRQEFQHFSAFSDPAARERIPDPQEPSTFEASRLAWSEAADEPHASVRRLYRALLALRQAESALQAGTDHHIEVTALGDECLALRRSAPDSTVLLVAWLAGSGPADLTATPLGRSGAGRTWTVCLTTEDPPFAPVSRPPGIQWRDGRPVVEFHRPGAVILRSASTGAETVGSQHRPG